MSHSVTDHRAGLIPLFGVIDSAAAQAARGAGGAIDGQYVWLKQVRRTFHLDTFHLRPTIRM
jgi:hypothetical protein